MLLSELIAKLNKALVQFGDVPVKITDPESGRKLLVYEVLKLHPYTALHGCMNRNEPVDSIEISTHPYNSSDLRIR